VVRQNKLIKINLIRQTTTNKLFITLISGVLFFASTMLFRQFFNLLAVMGIRPSALPPVLGLMLGPFGALGCALGNLLADIVLGYSLLISVLGFVAQFTYGILPYLMWKAIDEIKKKPATPVNFSTVGNVLRYLIIIVINATVMTIFLGSIIHNLGVSQFISTVTLMLLLNNVVFCIVLGVPIIVFISVLKFGVKGVNLSMNERLVLIFLITGIASGGLIGIFAYIELSDVIADPVTTWMRIYLYMTINLLVFYILSVTFLWYCEKKITTPISSIASIARSFVSGEGKKRDGKLIATECDKLIETKGEAGVLADAFKKMVLDLDTYIYNLTQITTENERISTELNVARQMQADMLPNTFPAFPERDEFEIFAMMEPAKEIGGDFYDFFMVDRDHLCIVIADVSGKGITAALFMVITRTLISNWTRSGMNPSDVFTKVNAQLCEGNESAMFVTAWMGILKISSGELTYSNAGHDPPLLMKSSESFEQLQTAKNLMLAAIDGIHYKQSLIQMNPGDKLFLYTDGVTEANNTKDEQYGQNRLLDVLNNTSFKRPSESLLEVKADIDIFANEEPQFDDITMLMLSIN